MLHFTLRSTGTEDLAVNRQKMFERSTTMHLLCMVCFILYFMDHQLRLSIATERLKMVHSPAASYPSENQEVIPCPFKER